MIPIRFRDPGQLKDLFDDILTGCRSDKLKAIEKWCNTNLNMKFRDVVFANFPTLNDIVSICPEYNGKDSPEEYRSIATYMQQSLYGRHFSMKFRRRFVSLLGELQVCPYCNRNYINPLESYNQFELDHFFPESKYPILAISFYNLVPCCPSCNHRKSTQELLYSPHDPSFMNASYLTHFTYTISDIDFIRNPKNIAVEILHDHVMDTNIEMLELVNAYQFHKTEVQDIIRKAQVYPKEYTDVLIAEFPELFSDRDEVEHMVYGINTDDDKQFLREPLSKLKSDIYSDILRDASNVAEY